MSEVGLGQGKEETVVGQFGHLRKPNCTVLLNPHTFSLFSHSWIESFFTSHNVLQLFTKRTLNNDLLALF